MYVDELANCHIGNTDRVIVRDRFAPMNIAILHKILIETKIWVGYRRLIVEAFHINKLLKGSLYPQRAGNGRDGAGDQHD